MIHLSKLGGQRSSLAIICIILFLTFLDNTIVSVVLAGLQTSLSAGVQSLQWIVDGYMLIFAALMLTGGTLGDIFGRKKIMLSGVAIFSAGSALAMLAPSTGILTAGRIIMGIGAAASEPGTLSMIRQIYPEHRARARALGIWAAVSGMALAFGPIIGGLIISASSWREVFTFNLVLGVIVLAAGLLVLPESADREGRILDIRGLALGATALATATFAVIRGETVGYGSRDIIVLFALSAVSMIGFVLAERRHRDPVLRLRLFRNPAFSVANIVAFATNFGVFAIFFFTALYLQIIAGFSGYHIALSFLAMAAAMVVAALLTGRFAARVGTAWPTIIGCALAGGGMFVVDAALEPGVNIAMLAWPLAIIGLGFGITLTTVTVSVLAVVSPQRSGMAASTVNTFRELGGTFGVAILGAIVNAQLTTSLANKLQDLGLPDSFQSLVIYATTHGGNTPANVHVNASAVLAHPQLVQQITDAAYQAFGHGLTIALRLAGVILLAAASISIIMLRHEKRTRPVLRQR